MSKSDYQPLTPAGAAVKESWQPCLSMMNRLLDLKEEASDMPGTPEAEELTAELREVSAQLEQARADIRHDIACTAALSSTERRILRLRYLCAYSWDVISHQVGREPSAIFTAYRKALNKVGCASQK